MHTYFKATTLGKMSAATNQKAEKKNISAYNDFSIEPANVPELKKNYVVSKFQCEKLYYDSYATLNIHQLPTNMWLDNFVVDVLKIMGQEKNIKILMRFEVDRLLNVT